jgi:hypothetical protein
MSRNHRQNIILKERHCRHFESVQIFLEEVDHRVIMYFIETKTTSGLNYLGHLPLNTYLSVVCIAAVAT